MNGMPIVTHSSICITHVHTRATQSSVEDRAQGAAAEAALMAGQVAALQADLKVCK